MSTSGTQKQVSISNYRTGTCRHCGVPIHTYGGDYRWSHMKNSMVGCENERLNHSAYSNHDPNYTNAEPETETDRVQKIIGKYEV